MEASVMSNPRLLAGLTATAVTAAIALVVGSCEANHTALAPKVGGPRFHFGAFECIPFKMTGGGRIDYPDRTAAKNPPAGHTHEAFRPHVITSRPTEANCTDLADKGAVDGIDHRPRLELHGPP